MNITHPAVPDPTAWGRVALIALCAATREVQETLGPRFPSFVDRYQVLYRKYDGVAFDPVAAANHLRKLFEEFGLLKWVDEHAAVSRSTAPIIQGEAVRTRGRTGGFATEQGTSLAVLMERAARRLEDACA